MQTYMIVGSLILATSVCMPAPVSAVDGRVEVGCANDYLAYCSRHDPDGRAVRRCMRLNADDRPVPCRRDDSCIATGGWLAFPAPVPTIGVTRAGPVPATIDRAT